MRLSYYVVLGFLVIAMVAVPSAEAGARSLTVGTSGSDVVALQNALISRGYLAADKNTGYFGSLTLGAVQKFQCETGIICATDSIAGYGLAGPRTQAALGVTSSTGGTSGTGSSNVAPGIQNPGSVVGPLTPKATGAFEFSGWIPDWRLASATADTLPHFNQLRSIMPFALSVSADGKLIDRTGITNKEPWLSYIAEAKRAGLRVVPTVMWGNGEEIHNVLSNTQKRIALEDEIANLVKAEGWDGIDIDFEAKKAETIDYFSTFLKGLYQRMGDKWVYCAIEARMPLENRYSPGATIPPDATNFANDYYAINKYCDRVELMTYDQGTIDLRLNAARTAPYAPVADPGWVESVVTLAAQTISRNKIILGVPTYGYEYLVTPLGGGGFQYKRLWAFNPGYALNLAAQYGATVTRTSASELGFTYKENTAGLAVGPSFSNTTQTQQSGNIPTTSVAQNAGAEGANALLPFNYVTWSDAAAIKDKVDLARRLGVRGVAVFSLGGAQDPAMWSILK